VCGVLHVLPNLNLFAVADVDIYPSLVCFCFTSFVVSDSNIGIMNYFTTIAAISGEIAPGCYYSFSSSSFFK